MDTIAFYKDSSEDYCLDIRVERRILRYKSEDVLQMNHTEFFAEGSYQHSVCEDFNVNIAHSTFCKVLAEVLNKLENLLCSKWISISMSADEERMAKMAFYEKCRIPNVVMAVDAGVRWLNPQAMS